MPPAPNTAAFLFGCRTCRKRAYGSRKQARRAARITHPGEHLRAYRCPHRPRFWHIGHLKPGDRDRDRDRRIRQAHTCQGSPPTGVTTTHTARIPTAA